MHILLFLTRNMSLAAWEESGSLTRELALYESMAQAGHKISIISWGGKAEKAYERRFPWLRVYCNQRHLALERYERLLPLLHARALWGCDIIKSNQTNGAEVALQAAHFWHKPFISRCGYLWSDFAARQKPRDLAKIKNIEQLVFTGARHCIVTSRNMRQTLIKDYAIAEAKVSVIPNYITQNFFNAPLPAYNKHGQKATICQVGRLVPQKNLPALITACAGLPVKLVLIGQGQEREALAELAASLAVELHMPGNIAHHSLPEILAKADICTLVSHYEGHPKALIEYMARGCPILATQAPGIAELANHESNALLCQTDAPSIQAGLQRMLNNPALRERLGKQARADAKTFTLDNIVAQELTLYQTINRSSKLASVVGAAQKASLFAARRLMRAGKAAWARRAVPPPAHSTPAANKPVAADWNNMNDKAFINVVLKELEKRTRKLSPANSLRLLFELEAKLYPLQGRMAVAYGDGLHTKHRHTRYHDFFTDRLAVNERVLDIGCGNGALAYDMAEKAGALVTGIDLNPDSIATAQQRFSHAHIVYICGNALTDLPAGEFDAIVLSNVLEHLPDRASFLAEIQENLHPKRYLIRVPLFERDWRVPLKKELGLEWRLDSTHETEYTLESFADEVKRAGLFITHQQIRWGEIWSELQPTPGDNNC